ncbi:MAG TPA: hypothetical protein PLZ05_03260 [Alphaproteobacteria bacterium]|nr:hypothetical protein [Alphaproteobacteria bacterium]
MSEKDIDAKVAQKIFNSFYTIKHIDSSGNYIFMNGTRRDDTTKMVSIFFDKQGNEIPDNKFAVKVQESDINKTLKAKDVDLKDFHLYESNLTKQQTLVYKEESNILITGVKDLELVKEYKSAGKDLLQFKAKILLFTKFSNEEFLFLVNKDGKNVFKNNNLVKTQTIYQDGTIVQTMEDNSFLIYDYSGDKPISLIMTELGKHITYLNYDYETGMVNYSIEKKQMKPVSIKELRELQNIQTKTKKLKSAKLDVLKAAEKNPEVNFVLVKEKDYN